MDLNKNFIIEVIKSLYTLNILQQIDVWMAWRECISYIVLNDINYRIS